MPPRRNPKRPAQRGMGVAQLERLRLQELHQQPHHQLQYHSHSHHTLSQYASTSANSPLSYSLDLLHTPPLQLHLPQADVGHFPASSNNTSVVLPTRTHTHTHSPPRLHLFFPDMAPISTCAEPDLISIAATPRQLPFTQTHQRSYFHGLLVESNLPKRQPSETSFIRSPKEVLSGHELGIVKTASSGKAVTSMASFELDFSTGSSTKGESNSAIRDMRSWPPLYSSTGMNLNTETNHAQIWGPILRIPAEKQIVMQDTAESRMCLSPPRPVGCSSKPPDNPSKDDRTSDVQQLVELSSFQQTMRCGEQVTFSSYDESATQLELASFQSRPQQVSSKALKEQPVRPWVAMDLNVPIGENDNSEERSTTIDAIMSPTDNPSFGGASSCSTSTTTASVKWDKPCARSSSQEEYIGSLLSLSSRYEPEMGLVLPSTTSFPAFVAPRKSTRTQGLASLSTRTTKQFAYDRSLKIPSSDFLKLGLPTFSEMRVESCTQGSDYEDSCGIKEHKALPRSSSIIGSNILGNKNPRLDQEKLKHTPGMLPHAAACPHGSGCKLDLMLGGSGDHFGDMELPVSITSQSQPFHSFIGAHDQHEVNDSHHIQYNKPRKDCVNIDLELRLYMSTLI